MIYYRLRQTDFDGKEELSKVVAIDLLGLQDLTGQGLRASPNPVSGGELILFLPDANGQTQEEEITVNLIYQTGRTVRSAKLKAGANPLDVSDLAAGFYWLKWSQGGVRKVEKIVLPPRK